MTRRFNVQVTNWLTSRDDVEFCIRNFKKQGESFAVAHKNGGWSVWREKHDTDPDDIVVQNPPEQWSEVYIEGDSVDPETLEEAAETEKQVA